MRGTVILSHSELMTSGLPGFCLLMCLTINSDGSPTWLLRSQLRPPDKHSWNNALYLLDGFYRNHVCFIWYFEILKGQYFLSGIHFIPQTLVTYGALSCPLLQAQRKSHLSSWSFPANPKYIDLFLFLRYIYRCHLIYHWVLSSF